MRICAPPAIEKNRSGRHKLLVALCRVWRPSEIDDLKFLVQAKCRQCKNGAVGWVLTIELRAHVW